MQLVKGHPGQVKNGFNNMDNWKRNFARFYLPAKKNIKFFHIVFKINNTDYYRYLIYNLSTGFKKN
jgi:hypothetical protein